MNHIIRHTEGSIQKLTQFVIKYIYSDSKSNTIPEARASRWKQQKKKSLTRIIPDMDSLKNHIKRANYIAYIQMHFSLKNHPSPLDNGWHMENGICLPTRSRLPPLPPNVTLAMSFSGEEDIVHDLHEDNDDDEEIPYVYTSSDEEDMCTYSDDESISSDSSNADSDMS